MMQPCHYSNITTMESKSTPGKAILLSAFWSNELQTKRQTSAILVFGEGNQPATVESTSQGTNYAEYHLLAKSHKPIIYPISIW